MNVGEGMVVYDKVISARVQSELPFMATENIMMDAVKKGGNRQELHERIRQHSMAAAAKVKVEGEKNDLVQRIAADEVFGLSESEINSILDGKNFIGRCPEQVDEFVDEFITPVLEAYKNEIGLHAELKV